jgi:hypothetical protein
VSFLVPLYTALAVVVGGLLANWLTTKLLGDEKGHVAAFALTVGILMGNSASIQRDSSVWWLSALGAFVGLALLWLLLFRRVLRHG